MPQLKWHAGLAHQARPHVLQGMQEASLPTAGTSKHRTGIPLRDSFLALWLACTRKPGLSGAGLQRELGLGSYRTARLLLRKLRAAMVRMDREALAGTVETDEPYLGGPETGVPGRRLAGKSLIVVAVELDGDRMGCVRLQHVPDASARSLKGFVERVLRHRSPRGDSQKVVVVAASPSTDRAATVRGSLGSLHSGTCPCTRFEFRRESSQHAKGRLTC